MKMPVLLSAFIASVILSCLLASSATADGTDQSVPDLFNPGAEAPIYCMALQADGKIVVGGDFVTLAGQRRVGIGRLSADGTLDPSFNPGTSQSLISVYSLAVQTDGKILVGGRFVLLGGQGCSRIGRLNPDGTLDTGFNPGAGNAVRVLVTQADGKILVGGEFLTLAGQSRWRIGRLNADGTLDTSFNPAPYAVIFSLAVQANGKILVGADYATIDRLNTNGTLDASINSGISGSVYSLALQADGKILVGGSFTTLGSQSRSYIARLNADGSLDPSFNPGANNYVYSMAVQADGKILVGGGFTMLGGQNCTNIGRLNADGSLDTSFTPGANDYVSSLAVQADGKILVGGNFTNLDGFSRRHIGRLTPTVPATQSLTFNGSTVTWLRGGSSPEVWRTTFDGSTNGTSWVALGAGTRVAGGWQLGGLSWPTNANLRARGFVAGGLGDGSGWFVETVVAPPIITNQPVSLTVSVGDITALTVGAGSFAPPLSYQWLFNGTNITGATNTSLTLTNVQLSQAGNYAMLVTNLYGSILSSSAILTVNPLLHFTWNPISSPQFVGIPFTVVVQAQNSTNGQAIDFTNTVVLLTTNGLPVTPTNSRNFVQGVWTGAVNAVQTGTNVVLQAVDSYGETGNANPINVVALPPLTTATSFGGALYICWPVSPAGFVLETSPDLSPGSWTPVSTPPDQIGDQYREPITVTTTNAFYRLRFSGP